MNLPQWIEDPKADPIIVFVVWQDAASQNKVDGMKELQFDYTLKAVGLFVRCDNDCLSICQDLWHDPEENNQPTMREVLHIPLPMIKSLRFTHASEMTDLGEIK